MKVDAAPFGPPTVKLPGASQQAYEHLRIGRKSLASAVDNRNVNVAGIFGHGPSLRLFRGQSVLIQITFRLPERASSPRSAQRITPSTFPSFSSAPRMRAASP